MSLHQLYEAYRLTGERDLLISFFLRVHLTAEMIEARYLQQATPVHPMLVATMARQFALAAAVISDADDARILASARPTKDLFGDPVALRTRHDYFLSLAHDLREAEQRWADREDPVALISGTASPDQSVCWGIFADSALYHAGRSADLLERIEKAMDEVVVAAKSAPTGPALPPQAYLPCIHAANELVSVSPSAHALREQLLDYLAGSIDDPRLSPIASTGGLSVAVGKGFVTQTVADAAWFVFVVTPESSGQVLRRTP